MSVKINIWGPDRYLSVKYKGIFDMEGLYKKIYDWLKKRKFEWHEPIIKDRHPEIGDEDEIVITGFRNDTDFMRVWISLYIHAYDMNDVDVVKDGKKQRLVKGRILVRMQADFELDYEEKWEGSKFQTGLRHFLINYIFDRKIRTYGDKIEYECHNLQEEIKKHFDMQAKGNQFADMW